MYVDEYSKWFILCGTSIRVNDVVPEYITSYPQSLYIDSCAGATNTSCAVKNALAPSSERSPSLCHHYIVNTRQPKPHQPHSIPNRATRTTNHRKLSTSNEPRNCYADVAVVRDVSGCCTHNDATTRMKSCGGKSKCTVLSEH